MFHCGFARDCTQESQDQQEEELEEVLREAVGESDGRSGHQTPRPAEGGWSSPAHRARRIVRGTEAEVRERLRSIQGATTTVINTAYVERLQATFRSRLAPVVRRSRAAPQKAPLEAGMWLVGTVYNFCRAHRSLRLPNNAGMVAGTHHWIERTPAQGAGLTDHSAGRFMSC